VLRLSRGDRLVPAGAQGGLLHLLPAVLARVAPLLAQHRRAAPAQDTRGARKGVAAEPHPAAVESGPHLSRSTQLGALHPLARRRGPPALLRGLDALQPAAGDARRGRRPGGGAEARAAVVPRRPRALLPRVGRVSRDRATLRATGAARAVARAGLVA